MKSIFFAILTIGLGAAPLSAAPIIIPQDIVFLIDSSGSISPEDYETQRDFLGDLYSNEIQDNGPARVGLIQFATEVQTLSNLNNDQSPAAINAVLSTMDQLGGQTNTGGAAAEALNMFDTQSEPNNPKLVVLITDGLPNVFGAPNICAVGNDLASEGIQTVAVTVGDQVEPQDLDCLVSVPSANNQWAVDDYDALFSLLQDNDFTGLFGQGSIQGSQGVPISGSLALLGFGLIGLRMNRITSLLKDTQP